MGIWYSLTSQTIYSCLLSLPFSHYICHVWGMMFSTWASSVGEVSLFLMCIVTRLTYSLHWQNLLKNIYAGSQPDSQYLQANCKCCSGGASAQLCREHVVIKCKRNTETKMACVEKACRGELRYHAITGWVICTHVMAFCAEVCQRVSKYPPCCCLRWITLNVPRERGSEAMAHNRKKKDVLLCVLFFEPTPEHIFHTVLHMNAYLCLSVSLSLSLK